MASNSVSYGASSLKPTGPSMSMVDNFGSVGIGNYKGVMLCNRPFGGTTAKTSGGGGVGEKTTFTCGVVAEQAGQNVPISGKEKMIKRPNKDSVLAKHKKWLSDLQKTKDRLEAELLEEARKKEESQLKFQENEKRMRLAARSALALHPDSNSGSDAKEAREDKESAADAKEELRFAAAYAASAEEKAQAKPETLTLSSTGAGAKGAKHSQQQHKPAWAMTEQAAGGLEEELQAGEEEALLDFARGLDFDRYIGDVEVQAVMERLRRRIADLEREVAVDDMRSTDAGSRAALRAKLEQMGLTEASLQLEAGRGAQGEESVAMAAARALLQEEDMEEMQAVHSAKSVAALLKTAKDKIAQVKAAVQPSSQAPPGEPRVLNEPIIVVHEPSEGSRLEVKNAISKLPYMNRNPAV